MSFLFQTLQAKHQKRRFFWLRFFLKNHIDIEHAFKACLGILFSISLLIFSGAIPIKKIRKAVTPLILKTFDVATLPFKGIETGYVFIQAQRDALSVYQELDFLKQRYNILSQQYNFLENRATHEGHLSFLGTIPYDFYLASVKGVIKKTYQEELILYTKDQKIPKNTPVLSSTGVIGRIHRTEGDYAYATGLMDPHSRIPVLVEGTPLYGILAVNDDGKLHIKHIEGDPQPFQYLKVGQKVLTSHIGNIFPKNLSVGVISAIKEGDIFVEHSAKDLYPSHAFLLKDKP